MLRTGTVRPPYPGLRPFEADEADLFFGRELHVDALLKRLSGSHFVAVVGESGSGKSSLVRAGLLPALEAGFVVEAGSDWRVAVMRPGGAPLAALAGALLAPGVLGPEGGAAHSEFALAELRRGPLGLVQLVRDAHLAPHCNTLIVVDQFEELFRYGREPAQKDQANVFVELLLNASQQRQVPIFVVLTMRSDFVGDCARFRGLPELLNDNQYLTPRLTRDQIAAAVREPARVCGGTVDQPLVDELCNAIGDDQDQLPLLQHLLLRMWDRATEQSTSARLTSDLSREMGGLRLALNNHAQQIYDSLLTEARQAIARAMFKSLTDPRSQRRDLRRDALVSEVAAVAAADVDAVIAVADEFRANGRHMLMPHSTVPLDAASRLDISHESLLRQWSTLAEWAGEESINAREFDRLREEAQREREQRGELLSGRDLARALDWIRQAEPTPAWAERYAPAGELDATLAFIRTSEAEVKRRKDEELLAAKREVDARRARYYSWISGGAVVLAGVVVILVWNLWRRAEDDRRKAVRQGDEAHASQLAANARLELPRDASLAVLLARAAVLEGGSDSAAVRALREAIAAHVPSVEAHEGLHPLSGAKSKTYIPDKNKNAWLEFFLSPASLSSLDDLAITPSGKDAVIWSAVSGEQIRTLHGHEGIIGSAGFSPNGRLAVTTGADSTARVWDVSTGRVLRILNHTEPVNRAVFNRNGTLLVTLGDDAVAKVWTVARLLENGSRSGDVETLEPHCTLEHYGNFVHASFSYDQKLLATVTQQVTDRRATRQAEVWDVTSDGCPKDPMPVPLLENMENLKWAGFSDTGAWLGVVTVDGEAIVLSVPDWKEHRRLAPQVPYELGDEDTPAGPLPPPLTWSHDGRRFAAAGGDNTVYVAKIATSERPIELRGHTGRVTGLAFSPTDGMLLTTSNDSTARLWTFSDDERVLERLVLSGHRDMVGSGVFSPKGDRIVTASDDGTVRSWTPLFALRERLLKDLRTASDLGEPDSVRLLADSDRLKASQQSGTSPGGRFALTLARDRVITVRDLRTQAPPEDVVRPSSAKARDDRSCAAKAISDDKSVAWYCPDDNLVLIARPGQPVPAEIPIADESNLESMRFSTNGRLLALTLEDYSVRIFDSSTGKPGPPMKGHDGRIRAIDFSDDDRFLVSASDDSTARVWEVASGVQIAAVATNGRQLTGTAFNPDGLSLLLLSPDRLLLWRCYACGDAPGLLEEVQRRRVERRLSLEEEDSYRLRSQELNAARADPSKHSHVPHDGGRQ